MKSPLQLCICNFTSYVLDSVYMRSSQNSQPNSDVSDVNGRKE